MADAPLTNPFVCGQPVSGPDFFGRNDELTRIFTQVARGGHYLVVGGPQSGKTSLLLHMAIPGAAERYGLHPDCLVAVFQASRRGSASLGAAMSQALRQALKRRLEARGESQGPLSGLLENLESYDPSGTLRKGVDTVSKVAGKAFGAVFKNVREQLAPHLSLPAAVPDPDGMVQLGKTLEQLRGRGLKPVLLVDDAEWLFQPREPGSYFEGLRRAMGSCTFVLAMARTLEEVAPEFPPFERLRLRLAALEPDEACALLVQNSSRGGVEVSPEWQDRCLEYAGCFPFVVQSYGFHLFPALRAGRNPDRHLLEAEVLDATRSAVEAQLSRLEPSPRERLEQRLRRAPTEENEADSPLRKEGMLLPDGRVAGIYRALLPAPPPWQASLPADPARAPLPADSSCACPAPEPAERTLLEVIEERIRLDTYLRERFTQIGTFVDIDVAGSTQIKMGEDDYKVIYSFEEFHKFQRALIEECGGRVLNAVADETMSLFPEPEQAIAFLRRLMAELPSFNRQRNQLKGAFEVRAGVHLGELIRDNSQERAYSRVLDIAGHLQKLAPDGGVLVSQQVFEALGQPAYLSAFKYSERDGIMTFRLEE